NDVGAPAAETGFAIAEIKAPELFELFVEAERTNFIPFRQECLAPFGKRFGVTEPERLEAPPGEAGAGRLLAQPHHARQHPAGKNVALDEIRSLAISVEQVVANRDDLQRRLAAGLKHLRDLAEIGRPVFLADGFEHLDRRDLVEWAANVAIILQADLHFFGET